jgi:hypothetical protein
MAETFLSLFCIPFSSGLYFVELTVWGPGAKPKAKAQGSKANINDKARRWVARTPSIILIQHHA